MSSVIIIQSVQYSISYLTKKRIPITLHTVYTSHMTYSHNTLEIAQDTLHIIHCTHYTLHITCGTRHSMHINKLILFFISDPFRAVPDRQARWDICWGALQSSVIMILLGPLPLPCPCLCLCPCPCPSVPAPTPRSPFPRACRWRCTVCPGTPSAGASSGPGPSRTVSAQSSMTTPSSSDRWRPSFRAASSSCCCQSTWSWLSFLSEIQDLLYQA